MPKYIRIFKCPTCTYGHLLSTFRCAYMCGLNDEANVLKYCDRWLGYKILLLREETWRHYLCR